jgi:predicted short-subunit dehydrogenase-like oxidoreductase (DUF2520 family)
MLTIGFIGAGITGTALAVRLAQQNYQVNAVASRTAASADTFADRINGCQSHKTAQEVADKAQLIFITTPDDVISTVAAGIRWHKDQYVVHCSGAHSTDILETANKTGAVTGCFHPLQTFAGIEQAIENIPGSTFAIEAGEPLATILLRGTLSNIERVGLPNCLTGPIARGDLGTIEKHLQALDEKAPALLSSYRELGLQTIPIAEAKGKIDTERAEALKALLKLN